MENAKAVSLKLLLHDGTTNGILSIRNDEWRDGEITIGDRSKAIEIANMSHKGGIYVLSSQLMCAVFLLEDLHDYIEQHLSQEKWWYRIAAITSKERYLSIDESAYLAEVMKEKAKTLGSLIYDDKNEYNELDSFQKASINQFANAAAELMCFLGNNMFSESYILNSKSKISLVTGKPNTYFSNANRKGARDYLAAQNIPVCDYFNYTAKRESNGEYWINARIETLSNDWTIIFNDTDAAELIVAKIPAYTLMTGNKTRPGLMVRPDKNCVDIGIDSASFVDRKSGVDFSPFLTIRVKYK